MSDHVEQMEPWQLGLLNLHEAGLDSRAYVTDGGRVSIDLKKQTNELSDVLVRAIRTRLGGTDAKDPQYATGRSNDSKSKYRNSGNHLKLNIVIQIVGSRGDVQPFLALGKVLKDVYGHRVRFATHPVFQDFVEKHGLEFFNIGGDPAELMAFMVKNPGLMPGQQALKEGQIGKRRKTMMEIMQRCWRSCFEPGDGMGGNSLQQHVTFVADAIIANPPSFAHVHCAERLGVPLHMVFTMPWSPTKAFAHPLSNVKSVDVDIELANLISYSLVELLTWQGLGDLINNFREITLGLSPLNMISGPSIMTRLRIPYTYCWSPAIIPKPSDWREHIKISGFCFLKEPIDYQASEDLQQFLDSGPPPLYIGFGSIVVDDPNSLTSMIFQAVERTGQRALVSQGWGQLGSDSITKPPSVHLLGNVPHDWLFKRVSCVVHHGGAGTTAAGIAAGKPTVVVPFFGDQPFWGSMIERAGAGPAPIPFAELTVDKLAQAITYSLEPSVVSKAQEMASVISEEDGNLRAAEFFHETLDYPKLECSVLSGEKAVWQLRNTTLRLCPLVASVLIKEQQITVDRLDLFRAVDYNVEGEPTDPFSGGASALIGTIGSLLGGITDIPPNIFARFKASSVESPAQRSTQDEASLVSTASNDGESKKLTLQQGLDAGRGAARIISAGLRSPMDFTLALAQGFHNAPRLYGDTTVRPRPEVQSFSSGMKAATMGLSQGFFDGLSGLVRLPVEGARRQGLEGFAKGVGKAIGGVVLKPAAGIWGVPGYLSLGLWQELRKRITTRSDAEMIASRIVQGQDALANLTLRQRDAILHKWASLNTRGVKPQPETTQDPDRGPLKETDIVQENIAAAIRNTSRGNKDEDRLIARAIEAQLLRGTNDDRSTFRATPASSIISTSSRDVTEELSTLSFPITPDEESFKNYKASGDDPNIESDEDDNIREALKKSAQDT